MGLKRETLIMLFILIPFFVLRRCSHNIKLAPEYLTTKNQSLIFCKYQAKGIVEYKGGGIIAGISSSRFADYYAVFEIGKTLKDLRKNNGVKIRAAFNKLYK